MKRYIIQGGNPLEGEVAVSGAKNAAASILPGALLVEGVCRIGNVPQISDVKLTIEIMERLGAKVRYIDTDTIEVDGRSVSLQMVPPELGSRMRASHFFIGSMLGRFGCALTPLPGGCDLGTRPIDQHLKGFSLMGASDLVEDGMVQVSLPQSEGERRLKGARIRFDMVTVGATMNLMLAAALAEGETVLENAAREPHIIDLAGFLNAMGADVSGAGTDTITIRGVSSLKGGEYRLIPDQIETGTYMAAAAAAGGEVKLTGVIPEHMECVSSVLREIGAEIEEGSGFLIVRKRKRLKGTDIITLPYPGFPTDMQPQMAAVLCLAEGRSTVTESIWEDRFRYTEELRRMGADIRVSGRTAVIEGVPQLHGAAVEACDLRAGAALVIAALAAEGKTEIGQIHFIERGYHDMAGKLSGLGAEIKVDVQ
jgi:UDP-N-acetylglucosamine 1-carboxyvinyltransferase